MEIFSARLRPNRVGAMLVCRWQATNLVLENRNLLKQRSKVAHKHMLFCYRKSHM